MQQLGDHVGYAKIKTVPMGIFERDRLSTGSPTHPHTQPPLFVGQSSRWLPKLQIFPMQVATFPCGIFHDLKDRKEPVWLQADIEIFMVGWFSWQSHA